MYAGVVVSGGYKVAHNNSFLKLGDDECRLNATAYATATYGRGCSR